MAVIRWSRVTLTATLAAILTTFTTSAAPHAQQASTTTTTVAIATPATGSAANTGSPVAPELKPTLHVRLPAEPSAFWLIPTSADTRAAKAPAMTQFAEAVKLEVDSNYARALPLLVKTPPGPLADYAAYYQGLAELRLGRPADAKRTFHELSQKPPVGYLVEGAALREAECDEALSDYAAAFEIYERLSKTKTTSPDDVLMRMAKAARASGNQEKAAETFARVLYEFPFSDLASSAAAELETLPVAPMIFGSPRYKLELGRAERLFGAKRYSAARPVFDALRRGASGDERELIDLRLAECDYFLKHARAARESVRPYIEKAARQGEALFFYAIATRDLGDHAEYERLIRKIVTDFPDQSWAEEALNNLATYYILQSEDEQADAIFREMYQKYPTGRYAERAAWKVGWWAFRSNRYAETTAAFESAAANFPRSDYRPAWLFWSARAHEALKDRATADARYTLVATDYLNTYYGRLASARLIEHGLRPPQRRLVADGTGSESGAAGPPALPPSESVVRALLALDLYDQAIDELRYAQKAWGDSSVIQATLGYIYNQRGDLRAGINAIKRAYPQYMAAGGEQIPTEILRVLFPVNYWALIKRYSAERQLDPYMIAALIAQESTFAPDVKSSANAYGLMQLLPSTGRQYARSLKINRRFSIGMLTTAEMNLRMGTAYFADLVQQFGGVHYALATYNAGPSRVAKWIAERPGVERDQFIDDIPFPETQGYVKKILGTAEDYRRLYGPGAATADDDADVVRAASAAQKSSVKSAQSSKSSKSGTSSKKTPVRKTTKKKTPKA